MRTLYRSTVNVKDVLHLTYAVSQKRPQVAILQVLSKMERKSLASAKSFGSRESGSWGFAIGKPIMGR